MLKNISDELMGTGKTMYKFNTNIRVPFTCNKTFTCNKVLFLPDLGYETSSAINCFDRFAAKTIDDSFVPQV